jgi:uncharacterized membrane protein (UPF0127 family)
MRLRVNNVTRSRLLADRAERAASFMDRFVGLMGRRSLAFGEGLHILPCNSIHTFFMRIPIDVAFLDPEGRVVKQFSALPPWRATSVYCQARRDAAGERDGAGGRARLRAGAVKRPTIQASGVLTLLAALC